MAKNQEERDFGAILAEFESGQAVERSGGDPTPGDRVSGRVLSIGGEQTFVDVGAKSDAVVATAELRDDDGALTVAVGDTVEGMVSGRDADSGCLVLRVRPGAGGGLGAGDVQLALQEISQAHEHRIPVEGTVTEAVKGGVAVTVSGLRAFCPISQLDLSFVEDAAEYVGRNLTFRVRKFEPAGRGGRPDVVLSRRDLLEEERRQREAEAMERVQPGAVLRGTVTSVTAYGAFIDVGGVEGLLHVSEMAHGRVEDPASVVAEGDVLEVKVLTVEERDKGGKRIALSRRALLGDPWEDVKGRFEPGASVRGLVKRLEAFGAFVEIAPGIEGLVHVSELAADRRVGHPREVVDLGQEVEVRVLEVDAARHRVSLSLATQAAAAGREEIAEHAVADAGRTGTALGSMASAFEKARKKEE
jgi:small subunit ribosomal protein S1